MNSRPKIRRDFAPYRPPTLFREDDAGPRHDAPSQARPPADPEPPAHRCRLTLAIDGRDYAVRVELIARPGIAPLHVVELAERRGQDRCTVGNHGPDGLIGTCDRFDPEAGCIHANAAYRAGLFPELDFAPVALAAGPAGGPRR